MPSVEIPKLPIDPHLDAVVRAVREGAAVVLKAAPGAGKTTRVPPALRAALKGEGVAAGKIIVLEPRRLAARLSAERIASELGESVGEAVGYQIRFEGKSSARTQILFVTEGVFLRMLRDDPKLAGISVVVLDEFHERHVQTDLALALTRKLQLTRRPDLRLVVMSATLDTAGLESYLAGNVRVFDIEGRTFPVVVEYMPGDEDGYDVDRTVVAAVRKMVADPRCSGDVLVFLTGLAEIRRCEGALNAARLDVEVVPLSAEIPARDQMRAFQKTPRRKIILATNVAETSLTLPYVTGVVDTGRAKIAGHATWSGMATLDVKRVSQASCVQRAGRAGRVAPGVTYRLYGEGDFLGRPAFTPPDVRRLDFTDTYLDLLAFGAASGERETNPETMIPWLEAPQPRAVEASRELLRLIGCLDASGGLTEFGKKVASVPLHPRLGAVVARAVERGIGNVGLLAACLLSEGMILSRGEPAATRDGSDVKLQIEILATLRRGGRLPYAALERSLDRQRAARVENAFRQLASRLKVPRAHEEIGVIDEKALAAALLAGFPDRVAKRRTVASQHQKPNERPLFNFCLGRGGVLAESSSARDADLIVALEATETQARTKDQSVMVQVASAIDLEGLLQDGAPSLFSTRKETTWSEDAERVDAWDRTYYGQIVVREARLPVASVDQAAIEELLREKLQERWPKPFDDASDLDEYHRRVKLLGDEKATADFPVFEGEMLELLLATICEGKRSFREIAERSLFEYVEEQLPYAASEKLRNALPAMITLKNGRKLKVVYEADRPPYVTGTMQDFFGLVETPSLHGGRLPLTVQLLGPNKRPVQITTDLAGFWERGYPAIKRELIRDYPRHHWPDDPKSAPPVQHKSKLPKP